MRLFAGTTRPRIPDVRRLWPERWVRWARLGRLVLIIASSGLAAPSVRLWLQTSLSPTRAGALPRQRLPSTMRT